MVFKNNKLKFLVMYRNFGHERQFFIFPCSRIPFGDYFMTKFIKHATVDIEIEMFDL